MADAPSWREQARILKSVLEGARPEDQDRDTMQWLIAGNLIRSGEQTKPCPTCGTPKYDFRYWRISSAGRLLVAALAEVE